MMKWISILLTLFIVVACIQDEENIVATDTSSSGSSSSGSSSSSTTVTKYFQVTAKGKNSIGSSYNLHQSGYGNESAPCRIAESNIGNGVGALNSTNDITCVLDAEELDLYFSGIDFTYAVDEGLCWGIKVRPFWYWSYPYGTNTSTHVVSNHGDIGCGGAGTCDGGACPTTTANSASEIFCDFDHRTVTNSNPPNCDPGSYTLTTYTYTSSASAGGCTLTNTSTTTVQCGGSLYNCIEGPGKDFRTNSLGYPISVVAYNGTSTSALGAISDKLSIDAPIDKERGNYYIANYTTKMVDSTYTYDNLNLYTYSTTSFTFTSKSDTYGARRISWPFYEFACVNPAYEYKARILIVVRDWDRKWTNTSSVAEAAPVGEMDDSSDQDPTDPSIGPYNDLSDWDNAVRSTTSTVTDTSTTLFAFPRPQG